MGKSGKVWKGGQGLSPTFLECIKSKLVEVKWVKYILKQCPKQMILNTFLLSLLLLLSRPKLGVKTSSAPKDDTRMRRKAKDSLNR